MSLYVDSSASLKRYIDEPDSALAMDLLASDDVLVTGRHTLVEVRRNLSRELNERDAARMRRAFSADLSEFSIIELDESTCELAASIAETTGVKTLDALHLGAARRAGGTLMTFLTFDLKQAQVARSLGFTVVGA